MVARPANMAAFAIHEVICFLDCFCFSASVSPSTAMPLIVCLYRCAARHGAGARSITFLLCECDHRADELIGLKVDVPGELIADFELVFVQEA